MFEYDPRDENRNEPTDYSGVKIAAILAPVFVLVTYFANADLALGVDIVLGMTIFAVKLRWELRKHLWFWVVIVSILALHVPLVLMFRVPRGNVPTLIYMMPLGIADFFIIIVAVDTAERIFSKGSSITTIDWR